MPGQCKSCEEIKSKVNEGRVTGDISLNQEIRKSTPLFVTEHREVQAQGH